MLQRVWMDETGPGFSEIQNISSLSSKKQDTSSKNWTVHFWALKNLKYLKILNKLATNVFKSIYFQKYSHTISEKLEKSCGEFQAILTVCKAKSSLLTPSWQEPRVQPNRMILCQTKRCLISRGRYLQKWKEGIQLSSLIDTTNESLSSRTLH